MPQTILLSLLLSISTPGINKAEQPKKPPPPPTGLTAKIQMQSEYGPEIFGLRLGMHDQSVGPLLVQRWFSLVENHEGMEKHLRNSVKLLPTIAGDRIWSEKPYTGGLNQPIIYVPNGSPREGICKPDKILLFSESNSIKGMIFATYVGDGRIAACEKHYGSIIGSLEELTEHRLVKTKNKMVDIGVAYKEFEWLKISVRYFQEDNTYIRCTTLRDLPPGGFGYFYFFIDGNKPE